ncbi:MAG: BTAD domain-containing putative transcriptional regulator [Erysipelotrichaceae bacterium]|nr:BTAD domain-containing putative transcriptional regulator [Erysipelotrichaceae bacterium]
MLEKTDPRLEVRMFGELTLSFKEESNQPLLYLGKNLKQFFEVLLYYRLNPLSKEQLIDLLWNDSDNPSSALKFAVHKLRQLLNSQSIFEDLDIIVTTKNGYGINPELAMVVDTEEVDRLWRFANDKSVSVIEKRELLNQLFSYIKQPFLVNSTHLMWTVPIREYYTGLFNRSLLFLLNEFELEKQYNYVMDLAQIGLKMEPYNEDFHYYYLNALVLSAQYRKAIDYYEHLSKQFYKEFNLQLSLRTKNLYNFIIAKEELETLDISELMNNLNDNSEFQGALYCEYEVFKRLYQIALRNSERTDEQTYVMLFDLNCAENDYVVSKMLERLKTAIGVSLRKGDVFARMNVSQFILLLPCKTEENAHMISSRIQQGFYKNTDRKLARIHYHISKLSRSN